ncbi:MAG TPA: peptidyl-prolyl cis-trans isomerase [Limnobacter sp.]|nr:peptidyl-prolyl cis-trans isomerase [Limnobacter sp.]
MMTDEQLQEAVPSMEAATGSSNGLMPKVLGGLLVLGLLGFGTYKMMDGPGSGLDANAAVANSPGEVNIAAVVAKVNGKPVTEGEIQGGVQSGVDKAIVIDRYINKVLAAERGRELYSDEAKAVIQAAEREVLSTLYTTRRLDELRKAVGEDEIKAFYDKNVLDENFKLWKVSYYLSGDNSDIQKTLQSMKDGDSKALEQLKPLVEVGDGFAATNVLPYNLGRVVSKMKKGEFSGVLQLRNGLLVLRIDDMKQIDKPKMDDVRNEIVENIVLMKFNQELEQMRKQAKVELG